MIKLHQQKIIRSILYYKIVLPSPLLPGQKIIITTPFHVKLPFNFSRGGHEVNLTATQWYQTGSLR
jgi:hypothetical protein